MEYLPWATKVTSQSSLLHINDWSPHRICSPCFFELSSLFRVIRLFLKPLRSSKFKEVNRVDEFEADEDDEIETPVESDVMLLGLSTFEKIPCCILIKFESVEKLKYKNRILSEFLIFYLSEMIILDFYE